MLKELYCRQLTYMTSHLCECSSDPPTWKRLYQTVRSSASLLLVFSFCDTYVSARLSLGELTVNDLGCQYAADSPPTHRCDWRLRQCVRRLTGLADASSFPGAPKATDRPPAVFFVSVLLQLPHLLALSIGEQIIDADIELTRKKAVERRLSLQIRTCGWYGKDSEPLQSLCRRHR
jgi:hypothetical protein